MDSAKKFFSKLLAQRDLDPKSLGIPLDFDDIKTKMNIIIFIFVEIPHMKQSLNTEKNEKIIMTWVLILSHWDQDSGLVGKILR